MLTLDFTFHHNEFKQEIESLIWLFFREVGLRDAELDDRWKNLSKLSKPTSRAFDDRSYHDIL
jgi:DNA polymerase sigma